MQDETWRVERRTVTTLPAKAPLPVGLDALRVRLGAEAGQARLAGRVSDVVLRCEGAAAPFSLLGPLTLVSGEARFSVDGATRIRVVLAWADQGIPRMAAGVLEQAVADGVEVVMEAWAPADEGVATGEPAHARTATTRPRKPEPDLQPPVSVPRVPAPAAEAPRLTPPRPADPAVTPTARPAASRPEPSVPSKQPTPPAASGWAAAVAASSRPVTSGGGDPDGVEVDEPDLAPGDVLIHPHFGRCRVAKAGDDEKIKVRLPAGRLVDLHLGVMRLFRCPDEDGKRVFKARLGRG